MSERIGQQLGSYRLIRLLGQGGFAEVYLGEHIYLKTQAAVKVLSGKLTLTDIEAFQQEAQRIATLKHPHILRVLDFGLDASTPFLVLEYALHGTLRDRHPRGSRVPWPLVVSYVKQMAEALHYAHNARLIHRDVKPENMLLDERETLLLSDFGIATVAHSTVTMKTLDSTGTPFYMAPEQFEGKPVTASDQYSLAVVVYEWLCGQCPYRGDSFFAIGMQHHSAPIPSLCIHDPSLSPDVEYVVQTALAKDPKRRFASIQAFAHALAQALQPMQPPIVVQTSQAPSLPPEQINEDRDQDAQEKPAAQEQATPLYVKPAREIISGHAEVRRTFEAGNNTVIAGCLILDGTLTHTSRVRVLRSRGKFKVYEGKVVSLRRGEKAVDEVESDYECGLMLENFNGYKIGDMLEIISGDADIPEVLPVKKPKADSERASEPEAIVLPGSDNKQDSAASLEVIYRDAPSPALANLLSNSAKTPLFSYDLNMAVEYIAWSPDGRYIASWGAGHETIQIWNVHANKRLCGWEINFGKDKFAWSPYNSLLLLYGHSREIRLWDATRGKHLHTYEGHEDWVNTAAWSPDGKHIASGDKKTIHVWEKLSNTPIFIYKQHTDKVRSVAWSPDGKCIMSASEDGFVRIWEAYTGRSLFSYKNEKKDKGWLDHVAWSPDGKYTTFYDHWTWTQEVWEAPSRRWLFPKGPLFSATVAKVNAIAWSPDSQYIAAFGGNYDDAELYISEIQTGKVFCVRIYKETPVRPWPKMAMTWLPDRLCIAVTGTTGVHVWQA